MVDVAIIDSGIDMRNTDLCNMVSKGFSLDFTNSNIVYQNEYNDLNGHGTYCASIIRRFCPEVRFTIIKILDQNKLGCSGCLIEALDYLYHNPVDIVNMSLSTQDEQFGKELWEICDKMKQSGMILVSSLANHAEISYPAVCGGVIGVRGSQFLKEKEYIYHSDETIQCLGSSIPVLVEGLNGIYTFFGGNSKAAANISGIIAAQLHKSGTTDNFEESFKENAQDTEKKGQTLPINCIINNKITIPEGLRDESDFKQLKMIMQEVLKIPVEKRKLLFERSILYPEFNIDRENLGKLMMAIEKEWKISLKKEEINFLSIRDITTIYNLLKRTEINEDFKK